MADPAHLAQLPSHRALILSTTFRYLGVVPARGRFDGSRATIWVAHLGAR